MANINKIKYYPDRFYIGLDGFDLTKLFEVSPDYTLSLQQAIFIHEYFHYLTNISTFQGVRSFHAAFCDMFKVVCRLFNREGLNAFPINSNTYPSCEYDVGYWKTLNGVFAEDQAMGKLSDEVKKSPNGSFTVTNITTELGELMTIEKDGELVSGKREFVRIEVDGLVYTKSFRLSLGAMDEFLSASVDEFIFEHNLADNKQILDIQPYYPYRTFDEILRYYGFRLASREKILIVYYAMHGKNPAVMLKSILDCIRSDGQDKFEANPCQYLESRFEFYVDYDDLINQISQFIEKADSFGIKLATKFLSYFQDRIITAQGLLRKDSFFFVRPFLVDELDKVARRQDFVLSFDRIRTCFPEPVILQNRNFAPLTQYNYGADLVVIGLAIYEIFESLKDNQVPKRTQNGKDKYDFPDGVANCDDVSTFGAPPLKAYWHRALNELGLYEALMKMLGHEV